MSSHKPHVLLMGQTPPPWHGQAVATQILFEHNWPDFEVHRLRMEFSEEMIEVGRFQWKKIRHLFHLIGEARTILRKNPECILFYPPASARWIPFLRDVVFLSFVRPFAGKTVFIFHASGLPVFTRSGLLRRLLAKPAYDRADFALEVAQELLPPHQAFATRSWQWCPCAIDVPDRTRGIRAAGAPQTILFVGSLQEGKGVVEILKTASVLRKQGREKDFRFRLVGKWFSSEFETDVRHMRAELGLEEMVELTGQLIGDDKWDAYFTADVFFFPTHYESEATPIVLMEALGAGLPIVSTLWAGIPAMLEGCETASLFPVRSPDLYADALAGFVSDNKIPDSSKDTSRQFYQDRFRPERFIERVEASFRSVLSDEWQSADSPPDDLRPDGQSKNKSSGSIEPTKEIGNPSPIAISTYLADQNPGHDRSFGISRMSQVVMEALQAGGQVRIDAIVSKTSQQAPPGVSVQRTIPWGTRRKWVRLLTDHFHPIFGNGGSTPDLHYFPKGYLPLLSSLCRPAVVTIHDTIIQYDEDHYPAWRSRWEYGYWAMMLKHTLRKADVILTVSESSRDQIQSFMARHRIPRKTIHVTYEPCLYEALPQPIEPAKENYVIHLASCEPHKRTAHLIRWWHEAETQGRDLPMLHLIGSVPPEVSSMLASSRSIVGRPFLDDSALQAAYMTSRALILPSEIEGFGLPALEAYYLGTPVCFVKGTSVEEILGAVIQRGGFELEQPDSLFSALDDVMTMNHDEIHEYGLRLRETYAAKKVAERMVKAFRGAVAG